MDKMVGKILSSRYEIVEKIGTGGMANVYKAKCNVLNRFVAIKIMKEEYIKDPEFLKRFRTESQAVALLSHPNIVSVYDVGVADGAPFIVMELIEGITLKEYINQHAPIEWKDAVYFSFQILRALEHAHGRNIVHRDIKPQNIMVLKNGTIKVADFGIARFTMSNTVTMTDDAIGTVHYLSPEQAKGSLAGEASDVYSVGVILYEMLTGKVPYDADNPVSVAMMHLSAKLILPSKINPMIPAGLEEIVLKAMARDVNDRYPAASAMLSDLDRFSKNPAITFEYKISFSEQQPTQYWKNENYREKYGGQGGKKGREKGRGSYTPLIAGALSALFLSLIGIFILWRIISPVVGEEITDIEVPDFTKQVYVEVVNNEEYLKNFKFEIGQERYDKEIPAGSIISQKPANKRMVKKGSVITFVVSRGTETKNMPNLENAEYRAAALQLENLEIAYELVFEENENFVQGHVFKTRPGPGEEVKEGDKAYLYISNGVEVKLTRVPGLVGLSEQEARMKLSDAGLVFGANSKYIESQKPSGIVVSQSREEDTEVEEGSEIILEISKGSVEKIYALEVQLPMSAVDIDIMVFANDKMIYSGRAAGGSLFSLPVAYTEDVTIQLYTGSYMYFSKKVMY